MRDAFDVLGVRPAMDLTGEEVRRAWLARALAMHPDRSAGGDAGDERAMAALNAAREALVDPLERAEALLARLGGPAASEDRSLGPEFLEWAMLWRESVGSAVGDAEAEASLLAEAAERESGAESAVRAALDADSRCADGGGVDLASLRRLLNEWRGARNAARQVRGC